MKSIKKAFSSLLATTLLLIVSTAQAETSYWSTITNSGSESDYNMYDPIGQIIYYIEVEMDNAGIDYSRYRVEINQSNFISNPLDAGADGIADALYVTSGDFDVSLSFEFATAADQAAFEQLVTNNVWSTGTIGNWLAGVDFGMSWQIDGSATLTSATGENDPVFDDLFTTKLSAGVPVEDQPTGEYVWKMDWDVDHDSNFQTEFFWYNWSLLTNEALRWTYDITALAYEFYNIYDDNDDFVERVWLSGIDPAEMMPTDIRWAWECDRRVSDLFSCRYSNNWYFTNEAAALAMDQWLLDTPHSADTHDSEQSQVASFMLNPSLASYPDNVRTRSLADFSGGTLPGHMSTDVDNNYDKLITHNQMLQGEQFYYNQVFNNEIIFTAAQDSDGDGITDNVDLNPTVACSNKITVTNANDSGAGSLRQALIDVCPASPLHAWDYAGMITFDADYTIKPITQMIIEQNLSIDGAGRNIVFDSADVGGQRVFVVNEGASASLSQLTLMNAARPYGAAIINNGDLSIEACHFENNQASKSGGAILNNHIINIENSIFSNNVAADGIGGAIYSNVNAASISIINSTFYENQASNNGDAFFVSTSQSPIYNLTNVLVVNSSPNTDCTGTTTTNNNNWIQDGSCSATYTGDPELNDPANDDYRPIPGSGVIDAGINTGVSATDFSGAARTSNAITDIGAHEYDPAGDFDGDGYIDTADNCTLAGNDQLDTDGDNYGNACDGDLNNDNWVNSLDLGLFKAEFSATGVLDSDMNGDNIVNSLDLGLFRNSFFTQPGPSGLNP